MTRANRTLTVAAFASLVVHIVVLGELPVPGFDAAEPASPPLDVHLVAARPAAMPVAESPKPPPPRKTVRVERKPPAPTVAPEAAVRAAVTVAAVPLPVDPSQLPADFAPEAAVASDSAAGLEMDDAALVAAATATAAEPNPETAASTQDFGPPAAYPIRRLKAVYDLYYGNAAPDAPVGRVTHTWSSDGGHYVAESVTEGVGLVRLFYSGKFAQRSEGRIGPDGLVPEQYTLRRGRAEVSDAARFDWSAATVALESNGQTRVVALARGAQDPLSAQHQFYFVQPLAASGQFRVADGRKMRAFWYEVVGEDLLETALGVVNTLHMRRADGDNASADVWVDPRRSYLPVKIRATDRKGRMIEQQIRSLEVEPFATAAFNLDSNR